MRYDTKKIKKQIEAESSLYKKFGTERIWVFILKEIFRNNTEEAMKFMLSPDGGYQRSELRRVMSKKECHTKYYNNKLECGLEAI